MREFIFISVAPVIGSAIAITIRWLYFHIFSTMTEKAADTDVRMRLVRNTCLCYKLMLSNAQSCILLHYNVAIAALKVLL